MKYHDGMKPYYASEIEAIKREAFVRGYKKAIDDVDDKFGGWSDGCGCCMTHVLHEKLPDLISDNQPDHDR